MLVLQKTVQICRIKRCSVLFHKSTLWKKLHNNNTALFSTANNNNHSYQTATFGQPVHHTHPHLINPGEVLKGIQLQEVQNRRINLLHSLKEYSASFTDKNSNHIVIVPSANKKYMSSKIPYVFRQNTDFLYLSGCQEPESVLVLEIDSSHNTKTTLFVRPKDKNAELWDGPRTGVQFARDIYGVDEALDVNSLKEYLTKYSFAQPNAVIWYDEHLSDLRNVSKIVQDVSHHTKSPLELIHALRVIKSDTESALMRKTCEIASHAINKTIEESHSGISEHQVFATVDYYARVHGANFLAYPPVVAGGSNATIIHYVNNNQIVNDGEMILLDAGCEYHGYTSDITRTWPVDGKFREPQLVLYEIIHQVQRELLDCLLFSGGETLDQLFDTMCSKLGKYLQEIKLIPPSLSGNDLSRAAYKFCPHHVSHYLGMDVHDTPLIARNVKLQSGMVCTVEPGIYIAKDKLDVPAEFRGLGIRIEDDVLIKPGKEIEILSKNCIKDPFVFAQTIGNKSKG